MIHTSFYEIYNEMVFDLLAQDITTSPLARTNNHRTNPNSNPNSNATATANATANATAELKSKQDRAAFRAGGRNLLLTELAQRRSLPVRYDEQSKCFRVQNLTSKLCAGKAQVLLAILTGEN